MPKKITKKNKLEKLNSKKISQNKALLQTNTQGKSVSKIKDKIDTSVDLQQPIEQSVFKKTKSFLKQLFFPTKENYSPQKQIQELQFAIYCLTAIYLIIAIFDPYYFIDTLILAIIAFNINKERKKYTAFLLVFYTLTTILINVLSSQPAFNLTNILLVIFSIQASRLIIFEKKTDTAVVK